MMRLDSGGGCDLSAGTARVGLPPHDVGHRVEHARLADDLGAVLGDPPLLVAGDQDGGAAGHRVAQRELADVVHQGGVLELEQRRLGHAELPSDGHREPAHPGRVPRLHVPADLGRPGERADRLQVGGPDPGVPAQRHLGDEQRHGEDRDRREPHDLGGEGDQERGRTGRGADRQLDAELVAERDHEPGPQRLRPDQGGDHRLNQPGDHHQGEHDGQLVPPFAADQRAVRERAEHERHAGRPPAAARPSR